MPSEVEDRLDLGCLVGSLTATITTKCGIVYQGTILDWNCGGITNARPDSSSSDSGDDQKESSPSPRMGGDNCRSFIRMELGCQPGNICCPLFTNTLNGSLVIGDDGGIIEFTLDAPATQSRVTAIRGTDADIPLYAVGSTVLINWDDVSSIGSIGTTEECLTPSPSAATSP
ncbi:hypothetical protein SPSIL_050870 [Sporomusa silvacetica DSM 10669]|uniref:Uncharacterized protein n=1 Tax=Sporomusa silvacetica DSM 10669 TaxID=1123289 RepID=A0ABZ3IU17_9FIRM|nr:hypothetical protein [Sporomusa silvacetica]OZC16605.1 hypothetical protein SPSIL_36990 [Sporomusa silvacetica DSM 10669]